MPELTPSALLLSIDLPRPCSYPQLRSAIRARWVWTRSCITVLHRGTAACAPALTWPPQIPDEVGLVQLQGDGRVVTAHLDPEPVERLGSEFGLTADPEPLVLARRARSLPAAVATDDIEALVDVDLALFAKVRSVIFEVGGGQGHGSVRQRWEPGSGGGPGPGSGRLWSGDCAR